MNDTKQLLDVHCEGNVLVIAFKAPHVNDTSNLEILEDALREVLIDFEQRFLLLDFSEVEIIVSRMINSLVLMVKRVRAEGGQVHLCGLDPKVERVFKTMRLDRVFDMYESLAEGLETMQGLEKQLHTAEFV
ncbi:MAG: STAS domain-containing protein [Planctomycetes bacterium]|nr:STAS domain-containing protein [Planctomycetota bacterium]